MILNKDSLIKILESEGEEKEKFFAEAAAVKLAAVGPKTYLRGLIEYSNVCRKNCYYCGIRCANPGVRRYTLTEEEALKAAQTAIERNLGSVVIQCGEITSERHTTNMEGLIKGIKRVSGGGLGITLSLGEQSGETYERWFDSGAHRYLLRIETSDRELYKTLHPADGLHSYDGRVEALKVLRKTGYQVGTGVMIGLPFQNVESLADDLLFMKRMDIDMCGMGPYIEHAETPLYNYRRELKPALWRADMTLKMIAALRLLMPDINIVATTALLTIDRNMWIKALNSGANVVMPNITPTCYREDYDLYENKSGWSETDIPGADTGFGEWGDSPHFIN